MSPDPDRIAHETTPSGGCFVRRFADGSAAELAYTRQEKVVTITHTGTPPQHRGNGIAAKLVEAAVAEFRAGGDKVIPACWYARDQFRTHPEWTDLLLQRGGAGR
jgi:uncharacterized protein